MFMASMGATAKTFDEMITTIHLNKSTHSMEAYKNLLEELIVSNIRYFYFKAYSTMIVCI